MKELARMRRVFPALAAALSLSAGPVMGASPPADLPSTRPTGIPDERSLEDLNREIEALHQRRRVLVSEAASLANEQHQAAQRVMKADEGLRDLKEQADEARAHAEHLERELQRLVLEHPDVAGVAEKRSALFEESQDLRIRLRDLIQQRNALRSAANRLEFFKERNQTTQDEGR
jgi:chromosome segregation ATPase